MVRPISSSLTYIKVREKIGLQETPCTLPNGVSASNFSFLTSVSLFPFIIYSNKCAFLKCIIDLWLCLLGSRVQLPLLFMLVQDYFFFNQWQKKKKIQTMVVLIKSVVLNISSWKFWAWACTNYKLFILIVFSCMFLLYIRKQPNFNRNVFFL